MHDHVQDTGIYSVFALLHNIVHDGMVMAMMIKMMMVTSHYKHENK